jgi:hypothetical protein
MTPDVPGVLVRLDPAKVRAAFGRWRCRIKPVIPDGCDPATTEAFDQDMLSLLRAVEDAE